ncbi:MAG: hypothetical protein KDE58_19570 [Caldilineaceae bacterium]|nr:hypothetical protein [Caldilineaceae bacterium]
MNSTPSPNHFEAFSVAFIEKVHQLIYIGYEDSLSRIKVVDKKANEENSITGFIVEALNKRKRVFSPSPRWITFFAFHDNSPRESGGRVGSDRPRADIIIEFNNEPGMPEFFFEAKRLKSGAFSIGQYVGDDGMGCFIDGNYAARYNEAGMLGYIQSDSIGIWQDKAQKKIIQDKIRLNLIESQTPVNIHSKITHEWLSKHQRNPIESRTIKLYHILLDCIPQSV